MSLVKPLIAYEFFKEIIDFWVSEVKGSFYALVKKPRGKILGENSKKLFDEVKYISERIYNKFAEKSDSFHYNYQYIYIFLYPKLNQSLKWRFDYITIANNRYKGKKWEDITNSKLYDKLPFRIFNFN